MSDSFSTTITVSTSRAGRSEERVPIIFRYSATENYLRIASKKIATTFTEGDVDNLNQQFVTALDQVRVASKDNAYLEPGDCQKYLQGLKQAGMAAYNTIFKKDADAVLREREDKAGASGLKFTLDLQPVTKLFWELLYQPAPGERPRDPADPKRFWGFRYQLGRIYEEAGPDAVDTSIHNGIFSTIHTKLRGARQEVTDIAQQLADLCTRHNLQLTVQLLDEEPSFCLIKNPSVDDLMEFMISDQFRYGMMHFACHCEDPGAGALQDYLSMTVGGQRLELSVANLTEYENIGFSREPFVFLNACGSATADHLLQSLSMPSGFLKLKASGVIATACTMPDVFATAFGTHFYHRLFEGTGVTEKIDVGVALLATRLHFLNEYNNPLGLAYGLYAQADHRLHLR